MKSSARVVSVIALLAMIVPGVLFFAGFIGHDAVKAAALTGTLAWFVTTPVWMGTELPPDASEVEI